MNTKNKRQDLSTKDGRKAAVAKLRERQAYAFKHRDNPDIRIDNSKMPAGSPMYYYCSVCGCMSAVLPENFVCDIPQYCPNCWELHEAKIIEGPSYALVQRDACKELVIHDNGDFYVCPHLLSCCPKCPKCTAKKC